MTGGEVPEEVYRVRASRLSSLSGEKAQGTGQQQLGLNNYVFVWPLRHSPPMRTPLRGVRWDFQIVRLSPPWLRTERHRVSKCVFPHSLVETEDPIVSKAAIC